MSYTLTPSQFMASGGNIPVTQDYLVTVNDGHGGTASQLLSIPLADIIAGLGGGGENQPPAFNGGNTLGQITDSPFLTTLTAHGTLFFSDPNDGQNHVVSVGNPILAGHTYQGSFVPGPAVIGTWQFGLLEPDPVAHTSGRISWTYSVPESAARSLSQGEVESLLFPVMVSDDQGGQATQMVRIDLFGGNESPFLLPPGTVLTANSSIAQYLLPPAQLAHSQSQSFSITENGSTTGSGSHHTLSGSIAYVDPDGFDHPSVSFAVTDIRHDGEADFNNLVQPLMDGFHYTVDQHGNYGTIFWTYDVSDSALDFLAQAQNLGVAGTFVVSDIGGSSMSQLNIALNGANDAPTIPGPDTTHVTLSLADHDTFGNFVFSDPDWFPDGHSVQFVPQNSESHGLMSGGTNVEGGRGQDGTVSWFYSVDPTGTIGPNQHDVFDVIVTDHSGATATHTVDIFLV